MPFALTGRTETLQIKLPLNGTARAFSSEVESGSRQETRQIKNLESRFDSIETEGTLEAACSAGTTLAPGTAQGHS
jgi:hypothetical protein